MCALYRTELKYLGGLLQIFFVVYLPQLAQDFAKPNKTSFFWAFSRAGNFYSSSNQS